jgi:FlaA1/EpsC-like NDP-sugar epimerase
MGYMPRWLVLVMDLLLCVVAYFCAYTLAYHFYYFQYADIDLYNCKNMLVILCCQFVWFWIFHTYAGIIRYSTFVDATKLLFAILANVITMLLIQLMSRLIMGDGIFLRLGIVFYAIFAFLFLFVLRLFVKSLCDVLIIRSGRAEAVVVYGTKSAGVAIAKMIRSDINSHFKVVGFIDDGHQDKQIFGLPIYSTSKGKTLIEFLKSKNVNRIIVSPLKFKEIDASKDLNYFIEAGFQLSMIPRIAEYKEGEEMEAFSVERNLKNLQIEDVIF